jgi:hypothetical protein
MQTRIACSILLLALAALPCAGAELNLYQWSEPAPVVLSGKITEQAGKYMELHIERVFRGPVEPGSKLLLDVKYANRERDLNVEPKPLRLIVGDRYMVLMHESSEKMAEGLPVYRLVRGVRGARRLPKEGAEVLLEALQTFVEVQDRGNEEATWDLLARMLEGNNPISLEVALGQHLKFRRGDPALLASLRPLLDYPGEAIRDEAVQLIAQIVERYGREGVPEEAELRSEIVARARRDESVRVRVAATRALGSFRGEGLIGILREIAADDPEQEVRYVAETILLDRRDQAGGAD